MKVPVSSEGKTDSASSAPAPYRRGSPSAKTVWVTLPIQNSLSRFSIMQLPCLRPWCLKRHSSFVKGLRWLDLSKGGADLTLQCNLNKLKELHDHFAQRHPRPGTCTQPIQPRLLKQRSRPTPIHPRPACCLRQGTKRTLSDPVRHISSALFCVFGLRVIWGDKS